MVTMLAVNGEVWLDKSLKHAVATMNKKNILAAIKNIDGGENYTGSL